jgi:hypothetical protein
MGYQGLSSWEQSGRGVKLTTHLHLVLRSRMREAIPPLPQYAFMAMCSVKAQGQLYLYIHQVNRPQYPLLQHYTVTTPKAMVVLTPSFRVWNVFTDAALHMGFWVSGDMRILSYSVNLKDRLHSDKGVKVKVQLSPCLTKYHAMKT